MARNVFEENEERPEVTRDEALQYGSKVHALLPPLEDGKHYEFVNLTAGTAIIVEDDVEGCGCSPYQGCSSCGKYQGTGENSPESVELRHG
ncbi:hypothetical protein SEA_MIEK_60 [Streptomyces phage Miek]|nr:hypothetical protein SEA_SENDITCS_59 [Streptomyces phage SendItCS]WIC89397.1 hypothetical protein SEA_MIEK_60 [Streptomyces phage Miek]